MTEPTSATLAQLPVDDPEPSEHEDASDYDSAWGGDIESETQSLTSTFFAYNYEHGRRYHAYREGAYWGPNDEAQSEQLDIAHHCFLLLLNDKLYLAPIDKPQRVLDVGTGTGIWAIASDFADQNPSSTVVGTDLSPIQPLWVPPNCSFEITDAEEEWNFQQDFDFIHVRSLYGCIADWPSFYRNVYQNLAPGAWFEQVEYSVEWIADDNTIPENHVFRRWGEVCFEAGERMGKTFKIVDQQRDFIEQAGFSDVTEKRFKMPLGPWPKDKRLKEIGRWHMLECYQGIEGWVLALLTRIMGWSFEEVQLLLAEVRTAFKDRSLHAYTAVSVVYARKPT